MRGSPILVGAFPGVLWNCQFRGVTPATLPRLVRVMPRQLRARALEPGAKVSSLHRRSIFLSRRVVSHPLGRARMADHTRMIGCLHQARKARGVVGGFFIREL